VLPAGWHVGMGRKGGCSTTTCLGMHAWIKQGVCVEGMGEGEGVMCAADGALLTASEGSFEGGERGRVEGGAKGEGRGGRGEEGRGKTGGRGEQHRRGGGRGGEWRD